MYEGKAMQYCSWHVRIVNVYQVSEIWKVYVYNSYGSCLYLFWLRNHKGVTHDVPITTSKTPPLKLAYQCEMKISKKRSTINLNVDLHI